jgi:hypothetical protein
MLDHLSRALAEGARRHIMERVRKIYPAGGVVQLEFLADELCWGDPDTIGSRVLAEYKRQCGPQMRFYALASVEDMSRGVTTVQVSIPELHYRHAMMDERIW